MPNVNFDDKKGQQNNQSRSNEAAEGITGWIQDTFNISQELARKGMITVGVIAFVVSLYFWVQLLL